MGDVVAAAPAAVEKWVPFALSLSKGRSPTVRQGFDRLSPNGKGSRFREAKQRAQRASSTTPKRFSM
jgi:hypothetical protein